MKPKLTNDDFKIMLQSIFFQNYWELHKNMGNCGPQFHHTSTHHRRHPHWPQLLPDDLGRIGIVHCVVRNVEANLSRFLPEKKEQQNGFHWKTQLTKSDPFNFNVVRLSILLAHVLLPRCKVAHEIPRKPIVCPGPTRNIENGLKSGMLAYCLEYAFAKICKELSNFGLQDAKNASSANCFALRDWREAHCGKRSKQEASRSQVFYIAIPATNVAKAHPIMVLLVDAPEVEQVGTWDHERVSGVSLFFAATVSLLMHVPSTGTKFCGPPSASEHCK